MQVSKQCEGEYSVCPPSRFDIEREEDLIEEVARVSYDSIDYQFPNIVHNARFRIANAKTQKLHSLKHLLAGLNYNEVITYSFISPEYAKAFDIYSDARKVANPISEDLSVMRKSLWPSLVKVAEHNKIARKKELRYMKLAISFPVSLVNILKLSACQGCFGVRRCQLSGH